MTGEGVPEDVISDDLSALVAHLAGQLRAVPEEKREDALGAVEGVLAAFNRKSN
jgi:hypothetical protein